ncbi:target of Nesh-SH3 isoform X1 [Esox lucius]|uniref:Fibronectin type-III domain-containing protein n=2 Tax=Esox lucius TaxID=8010 RepID=A0AAY5K105_ESOLU|nr:target of Nesh-SH3 isoform X1 [Esox lucius]
MQRTLTFLIFFFLIFLVRMAMVGSSTARRSRVRRQNMKVKINATGDTIVMKFVLPNSDTKLEGFILGYGSSMFSKQFLPLPEDGLPLQTEIDAEPKYLIAVHPVPVNHVRKRCTGKVNLEKPLHLVIGSVTPTTVLLSWGTILKTPYEENIMDNCLEDGHYTIRYRERNRKWNYQTCPTSDTVIDHLKPNTPYEFGVRSNNKERNGMWSPPVIHSTITDEKSPRKTQNPQPPLPPKKTVHQPLFPLHHAVHNRNESKPLHRTPGAPRTIFAPTSATRQRFLSTPRPTMPLVQQETNDTSFQRPLTSTNPHAPIGSTMPARNTKSPRGRVSSHTTPNGIKPVSPPRKPITNSFLNPGKKGAPKAEKEHQKPDVLSSKHGSSAVPRPSTPFNKMPNLVGKQVEKEEPMNLKGDTASILKPFPPVTAKPAKQKTMTLLPAMNASADNSSVFSALPASEVDALGKKRFVAPHVVYRVNKAPDEPCSITNSLSYFPEEEWVEQNVTAPPRLPPSNVTVVTVEGCSSFVILDWEKADNETTEYEVISRTKGPLGEEVSILTTNQTHTAVENLNPESSYEFEVKSKNELGESPASDPVSFSTESADPRVSETVSGKAAIWTQFPFNADSYSECNGKQYVKRTWYRKFVGIQLCNSLRYKIYMSDSLTGKFYNIGDQTGHGEDHCQFVDSFLDGRTGSQLLADQLPGRLGFYRAVRQEPVHFGEIGANSHATYVAWYECGTPIPGKW